MAQKCDAKDRKEGTDYPIASMKNRIIRCTQGLFGSQSLLYLVCVFSQKVPLYIPMSSGRVKVSIPAFTGTNNHLYATAGNSLIFSVLLIRTMLPIIAALS